jgi:glycogen debranching enzyme
VGGADPGRRHARALVAGSAFGARLPELFCGFDRTEFELPVPHPTSCSPQAWAAASPLLLLRAALGLDPDVPRGQVAITPRLLPELGELQLENAPLAAARLTITVDSGGTAVTGLPPGVVVGPAGQALATGSARGKGVG